MRSRSASVRRWSESPAAFSPCITISILKSAASSAPSRLPSSRWADSAASRAHSSPGSWSAWCRPWADTSSIPPISTRSSSCSTCWSSGSAPRVFVAGKVIAVAVRLALVVFPFVITGPFPLHVMILTFLFAALGVAWNIMGGYAGMFSFGQAAFFGIGAYTSSFLLTRYGVTPWLGLLAGGALAALTAAAIGYPCSHLRGHYFAIASIAFAEIVRTPLNNQKHTRAPQGARRSTYPLQRPTL